MGAMAKTELTIPLYGVRTPVERTAPAIRAALDTDRRVEFEVEFRAALAQVDDDFDVDALQRVIDCWWPQALLCANPDVQQGANEDRRRIASGDPTVLGATTAYPHARPAA